MGELGLVDGIEDIRAAEDVVAVFQAARRTARRVAAADGATVVLREAGNCFYADEDAMSPLWKGQRFPIDHCISGWAMLEGNIAIVPDITVDDRIPVEAYRPTFVKSLVIVPVGASPAIAAIGAYWAHNHTATAREVDDLRQVANATEAALNRVGLVNAPYTPSAMNDTE